MMTYILEIMFSGLWPFVGMLLIFEALINTVTALWSRLLRMLMVRKHGWPPSHLDADGDWPKIKEDKS